MISKLIKLTLVFVVFSLITTPTAPTVNAAVATDFNPTRIVDDSIFFNPNTMTANDIQSFLNAKVPVCDAGYTCLKSYFQTHPTIAADAYCGGITGASKSAANIIFDVSRACNVNPQAIIVLLQKEQGLVVDTQPTDLQYKIATGYGCPDTAAVCDAEYYGFFNQVYNAARQFNRYVKQPQLFNYAAGRNSFVQYNPNVNCGGTDVTLHNGATAALYNYTPYQPNASALNNLYGLGDSCSAYGNRNFWRLFSDWFGPPTGNDYVLAIPDNGDMRQWVIQAGKRYLVPDTDIVRAYGLPGPTIYPGTYIGAFPEGPSLTRLIRPAGSLNVYFVDNGTKSKIQNLEMLKAWNFDTNQIVDVVTSLGKLPKDAGDLNYTVRVGGGLSVYLVDGGALRYIQNTLTLESWEGPAPNVTSISNDYFNKSVLGTDLASPRIVDASGVEYIVSNRTKYSLDGVTTKLYPWTSALVSSSSTNRLASMKLSPLVRISGDSRVYIIDNQTKHYVTDPNVLNAWNLSASEVTPLSKIVIDAITEGAQISDYYASNLSKFYVIDQSKRLIPADLVTAYTGTRSVYAASEPLLSLLVSKSDVTRYIKDASQPQVYLLTNGGKKRHLTSQNKLYLWAGSTPVTTLSAQNTQKFLSGEAVSAYVTNGTSEYVMDNGKKSLISSTVKTNWKLSSPELLNDGTLESLPDGLPLSNSVNDNGSYYLVNDGVAYATIDKNIADIWKLTSAPLGDSTIFKDLLSTQPMTRFALSKKPDDIRLFIADQGSLYHLTPDQARNLRNTGPYMFVDPELITQKAISLWTGVLVRSTAGTYYVLDSGGKRIFTDSIISDHWRRNVDASVVVTSDGFINSIPTIGTVDRAIRGTTTSIYSAESLSKRWVRSEQSYVNNFGTHTVVGDDLIRLLTAGADIN